MRCVAFVTCFPHRLRVRVLNAWTYSVAEMLSAGLTTVVGVLGTDTVTRTPVDLLATVNGINTSPMTAMFYTGGYDGLDIPTVTGSVKRDISLIPGCIGVGEVAMSDFRGSQPSLMEVTWKR